MRCNKRWLFDAQLNIWSTKNHVAVGNLFMNSTQRQHATANRISRIMCGGTRICMSASLNYHAPKVRFSQPESASSRCLLAKSDTRRKPTASRVSANYRFNLIWKNVLMLRGDTRNCKLFDCTRTALPFHQGCSL